jgi:hypothetical protein
MDRLLQLPNGLAKEWEINPIRRGGARCRQRRHQGSGIWRKEFKGKPSLGGSVMRVLGLMVLLALTGCQSAPPLDTAQCQASGVDNTNPAYTKYPKGCFRNNS